MDGEATPETDKPAVPAPSIIWPYLAFGPLVPAVPVLFGSLMISQALRAPALSSYLTALALTYAVFSPISLLLALIHKQVYIQRGAHQLRPVVGWALMFGAVLATVMIASERQAMRFAEGMMYLSIALVCMTLMAMVGFFSVQLVNQSKRNAPAAVKGDGEAT